MPIVETAAGAMAVASALPKRWFIRPGANRKRHQQRAREAESNPMLYAELLHAQATGQAFYGDKPGDIVNWIRHPPGLYHGPALPPELAQQAALAQESESTRFPAYDRSQDGSGGRISFAGQQFSMVQIAAFGLLAFLLLQWAMSARRRR